LIEDPRHKVQGTRKIQEDKAQEGSRKEEGKR